MERVINHPWQLTGNRLLIGEEEPISIEVERKRIRNLYLYVKPGGRVVISAPLAFSEEEIASFAYRKRLWIQKNLRVMRGIGEHTRTHYLAPDHIRLWGVPYARRDLPDKKKSLSFQDDTAILYGPLSLSEEEKERFVKAQLKLRLTRAIALRLPYWEKETGLYASGFHVRDMKSRWGSCNTGTKMLTFHLQLVTMEPQYLDYVIVHELTHLRHRRHDRAFWNAVRRYIPSCRMLKEEMDRY